MNGLNIEINPNSIAKRAYEIHLSRKELNGDALSDWLRAEAELKNELMEELNKDSAPAQKSATLVKKAISVRSRKAKVPKH